jgi:catechol 2,3-dioxygenase-like lactoylglutathione lyase family enzyme
MAVALNHMIIPAKDRRKSARFLANILGLEVGKDWGPFAPLDTGNGVTLDFVDSQYKDIRSMHCAFLVSEPEFDAALARVKKAGIEFYAEFDESGCGEINHLYGGRGFYFYDPDGHLFELITRPYGETPEMWTGGAAVKRKT